jgi:hypothetical protein
MEEKNLFIVEFGEGYRERISMSFGGPTVKPIHVVARDYNQAAQKGQYYLDAKLEEIMEDGVLEKDGSLSNNDKCNIKIVGVSHVTNIIW